MAFKLISEAIDEPAEIITEAAEGSTAPQLYIKGPFMAAELQNRNGRIYNLDAMTEAVDTYINEWVNTSRAMGELNHPASGTVNPERACHLVTEITQKDNIFYGKARILPTPIGDVVRGLLSGGVKLGVSSRAMGKLVPITENTNRVVKMNLVAIDCVSDPSYPQAFVDGILESTDFVLNKHGVFEPVYEQFRKDIDSLPKKEVTAYLTSKVVDFISKLSN